MFGVIWFLFKFVLLGFGVVEDEGSLLMFCFVLNIIGFVGFIIGWLFSDGKFCGNLYLKNGIDEGL